MGRERFFFFSFPLVVGEGAEGERWVQRGSDGFMNKTGGEEEGMEGKRGDASEIKREREGGGGGGRGSVGEGTEREWLAFMGCRCGAVGFWQGPRAPESPAGWHRGEEEVTAAHKAESGEGEEGEKIGGPNARKPGLQPGEASTSGPWLYAHPNILEVLRQATRKSHGLIHNRKEPRPDEPLSGTNSFKGGRISLSECISVDVLILIKDTHTQESRGCNLDPFSVLRPMTNSTSV